MNRDYFRLEKRWGIANIYPSLSLFGSDGDGWDRESGVCQRTEHVTCFRAREARLRWFEQVQRRDSEYISRNMLRGRVT